MRSPLGIHSSRSLPTRLSHVCCTPRQRPARVNASGSNQPQPQKEDSDLASRDASYARSSHIEVSATSSQAGTEARDSLPNSPVDASFSLPIGQTSAFAAIGASADALFHEAINDDDIFSAPVAVTPVNNLQQFAVSTSAVPELTCTGSDGDDAYAHLQYPALGYDIPQGPQPPVSMPKLSADQASSGQQPQQQFQRMDAQQQRVDTQQQQQRVDAQQQQRIDAQQQQNGYMRQQVPRTGNPPIQQPSPSQRPPAYSFTPPPTAHIPLDTWKSQYPAPPGYRAPPAADTQRYYRGTPEPSQGVPSGLLRIDDQSQSYSQNPYQPVAPPSSQYGAQYGNQYGSQYGASQYGGSQQQFQQYASPYGQSYSYDMPPPAQATRPAGAYAPPDASQYYYSPAPARTSDPTPAPPPRPYYDFPSAPAAYGGYGDSTMQPQGGNGGGYSQKYEYAGNSPYGNGDPYGNSDPYGNAPPPPPPRSYTSNDPSYPGIELLSPGYPEYEKQQQSGKRPSGERTRAYSEQPPAPPTYSDYTGRSSPSAASQFLDNYPPPNAQFSQPPSTSRAAYAAPPPPPTQPPSEYYSYQDRSQQYGSRVPGGGGGGGYPSSPYQSNYNAPPPPAAYQQQGPPSYAQPGPRYSQNGPSYYQYPQSASPELSGGSDGSPLFTPVVDKSIMSQLAVSDRGPLIVAKISTPSVPELPVLADMPSAATDLSLFIVAAICLLAARASVIRSVLAGPSAADKGAKHRTSSPSEA